MPAAGAMIEREVSLRLLRHLASSVRHQQYHDTEIVTVRVERPGTVPQRHPSGVDAVLNSLS